MMVPFLKESIDEIEIHPQRLLDFKCNFLSGFTFFTLLPLSDYQNDLMEKVYSVSSERGTYYFSFCKTMPNRNCDGTQT